MTEQVQQEISQETSAPAETVETPSSTEQAPQESAYSPDFSYTVYDQKHEFDEWLRPSIKSKEHEQYLRELFTSAKGLPILKDKNTVLSKEIEEKYKPMASELEGVKDLVRTLQHYRSKKDWKNFYNELGLKDAEIIEYVKELAAYQELTPEQKALADREYEARTKGYQLEQENQNYQAEYLDMASKVRGIELSNELNKEDVSLFAKNFDALAGRPGAFREEVINQGIMEYNLSGTDLSAQEVVSRVMKRYPGFAKQMQNVSAPTQQSTHQKVVTQKKEQPVIPDVQGSTSSPVKKKFTSIEELKKYSEELKQQQI